MKLGFTLLREYLVRIILQKITIIEMFLSPELQPEQVRQLDPAAVRSITMDDFLDSLKRIRRSVSPQSLIAYEKWSLQYGDMSL